MDPFKLSDRGASPDLPSVTRNNCSPGRVVQRQLQLQLLDLKQQHAKLEHDVERCRDALESPPADTDVDPGSMARHARGAWRHHGTEWISGYKTQFAKAWMSCIALATTQESLASRMGGFATRSTLSMEKAFRASRGVIRPRECFWLVIIASGEEI